MRVYRYIPRVVKEHPWIIIIVSLALTAGLGVGLLFTQKQIAYKGMLPEEFPSIKALSTLNEAFGGISYETVIIRAPSVTDAKIVEFLVGLEDYLNEDPRFNKGRINVTEGEKGPGTPEILRRPVPVIQDYLTPFIANVKKSVAAAGFDIKLSAITNDLIKMQTGKDFKQTVEEVYLSNPGVQASMVGKQKFITPDYKTALVMIKFNSTLPDNEQARLGNDLEDLFKTKLKGVPGIKIYLSGDASLARDFDRHIKNKTTPLFMLAIVIAVLALMLAFRRVTDTLVISGIMLISLVWTFGLMGYLHIPYNIASVAIMPLLLGHALAFVVPFVARYYEEMGHRPGPLVALVRTMMTVGVALFPAAATCIVGFLVFEFSVLPPLRDFGVVSAIGTASLLLLSVTMLPAIMVVRDRPLEETLSESRRNKLEARIDKSIRYQNKSFFARGANRVLEWFFFISTRHSLAVIIISAVVMIAGFTSIVGLTTDSDLKKLIPADLSAMRASNVRVHEFGPDQNDVIMVKGDVLSPRSIKAMAQLENSIYEDRRNTYYVYDKKLRRKVKQTYYDKDAIKGLSDVVIGANNGKLPQTRDEVTRALQVAVDNGAYVGGVLSSNHRVGLISLNGIAAQKPENLIAKMQILQDNSKRILGNAGLKFELGGLTIITWDMTKHTIPTEIRSSGLSLIICGLLLILIFRSLMYGLITLTVAFAGVAAEIGFLWLIKYPLDFATSLSSALVIGVGVAFGVLFTHRYLQTTRKEGTISDSAILSAMMNLGRANVVAAISTIAGLLIIMLSQIMLLKRFGLATAFGVGWSVIASLTLLPALLHLLSKRQELHGKKRAKEAPQPETPSETA